MIDNGKATALQIHEAVKIALISHTQKIPGEMGLQSTCDDDVICKCTYEAQIQPFVEVQLTKAKSMTTGNF